MKLNQLIYCIDEHKQKSGGFWPFKRSFSKQFLALESMVKDFFPGDRDLSLGEIHQLSTVLMTYEDANEADFRFIEKLKEPVLGECYAFTMPALSVLKANDRLTMRNWNTVCTYRFAANIKDYATLLCKIPKAYFTDDFYTIFNSMALPVNVAKEVVDILMQNDCLSLDTLKILGKRDLDYVKVAETLVACKKLGVLDECVITYVIDNGARYKYNYQQCLDELLNSLGRLKQAGAISPDYLKALTHYTLSMMTPVTDGLLTLHKAGLNDYAKHLHGSYGRMYPKEIAEVLVLLNHFGRLNHEVANESIDHHRQPENMLKPLQMLKDANNNKPEYIDLILKYLDETQTIYYALELEKANVSFDLQSLDVMVSHTSIVAPETLSVAMLQERLNQPLPEKPLAAAFKP